MFLYETQLIWNSNANIWGTFYGNLNWILLDFLPWVCSCCCAICYLVNFTKNYENIYQPYFGVNLTKITKISWMRRKSSSQIFEFTNFSDNSKNIFEPLYNHDFKSLNLWVGCLQLILSSSICFYFYWSNWENWRNDGSNCVICSSSIFSNLKWFLMKK